MRVLKDTIQDEVPDYPAPTQLCFPYPGSKWELAKKFRKYYPPCTTWVSLFGGSGAEIATKPPTKLTIFNDIDQNVTSVFRVILAP